MDRGMFLKRNIFNRILKGLSFSPVVLVTGPRQAGKSTLVKELAALQNLEYISFDEISYLAAAQSDPVGFLRSLKTPVILDEIQRVPGIFLSLKAEIDKNRKPGMYLFTGSANPLFVPNLGDALTGRMVMYELWPFSQGELEGRKEDFLDKIFTQKFAPGAHQTPCSKKDILDRILIGGFPLLQQIVGPRERGDWCNGYLLSALQKDIQDLARIEGSAHLPNLLLTLASRVGSTLNVSDISRVISTPVTTIRRYLQLLHSLYLLYTLPPWHLNVSKKIIKSPKVYITDTALLLSILRFNRDYLEANPLVLGCIVENFVVMELVKQSTWCEEPVQLYHFRTENGKEVDVVLENAAGEVVGLEIKFKESLNKNDFEGLLVLKESCGNRLKKGIVLYAGDKFLTFGDNLYGMPMSMLWSSG